MLSRRRRIGMRINSGDALSMSDACGASPSRGLIGGIWETAAPTRWWPCGAKTGEPGLIQATMSLIHHGALW